MKKVEVISYMEDEPKVTATLFWSPETGVLCDNDTLRRWLSFGIAVPPNGEIIYADRGLEFLNALKFRFNGLSSAGDPVDAQSGKGKPVEVRKGESPFAFMTRKNNQ